MKIESSTKPALSTPVKDARGQTVGRTKAPEDDVQLSGLSADLAASASEPAFDAGRVAEIKQAIAEGRFSINPGAIADRLLASAKELIDAGRKA